MRSIAIIFAIAGIAAAQTGGGVFPPTAGVTGAVTNGAAFYNGTSLTTTAASGTGTFCLVSTNGGTPTFGSCAGSASTVYSALTNPTGNLALAMGSFTSLFTMGATTGAGNGLKWTDTASNTGTGILGWYTTASGSGMTPFQADSNGNGFKVSPSGVLTLVGTGSYGSISGTTATFSSTLAATGHVTFEGVTSTGASGTGLLLFGTSPTIVTPTVASFTNATHTHQNAAGGGTLNAAAIAAGVLTGAVGGTNNGFWQIAGPATSLKTHTWPNQSIDFTALTGVLLMTAGVPSVVSGTGTNCVLVNGTSGTCGSGGGSNAVLTATSFSTTPTYPVTASSSIQIFTMTLTDNVTSSTLTTTSATAGQLIGWIYTQDGTGGRTVVHPTNLIGACAISGTLNKSTEIIGTFDGTNVVNPTCVTADNFIAGPETSAAGTPTATNAVCWFDSTDHSGLECKANNSANTFKLILAGVDINTVTGQVTNTHLGSPLPVAQGGWGLATLTANALYAGNATSAPTAITPVNNAVLVTNGSGVPSESTTLPSGLSATNMTLVTPALGTPASGVGTNITGVPLKSSCDLIIGDTSGSALVDAQLGPQRKICQVPYAATITELDISADAGTPSVIIAKRHCTASPCVTGSNETVTNLVSGALSTASSGGTACSKTGATAGLDTFTTCSATLQNTSLSVGDYLELVSGTAGGTAKEFTVHVHYTYVNQ